MWELTKSFRFEAAHSLDRLVESDASRRIHGHSYRVTVAVRGKPDPDTGMVTDLGNLERQLAETRQTLDHRLLDELPTLGPATLENISVWIWERIAPVAAGLSRVTVHRDSLDESCSYEGVSA